MKPTQSTKAERDQAQEIDPQDFGLRNQNELTKDFENLMNRHCVDSELNVPDFILAEYLVSHLTDLKLMNAQTKQWKGET